MRKSLLAWCVAVIVAGACVAQEGTISVAVNTPGRKARITPFCAVTETEFNRTLGNGNHIHRVTSGKVCRDSQGRTYNEMVYGEPMRGIVEPRVSINDPVSKTHILLLTESKIANVLHYGDAMATARVETQEENALTDAVDGPKSKVEVKTEDLGEKVIDGVPSRGTRMTRTVPAGAIGNELPINVVFEQWRANEIPLAMLMINNNDENGDTVTRVKTIQMGEPDAAIFQLPAGYKVHDTTPPPASPRSN